MASVAQKIARKESDTRLTETNGREDDFRHQRRSIESGFTCPRMGGHQRPADEPRARNVIQP